MFSLNKNTRFITETDTPPVMNAVSMLERDRDKVFVASPERGGEVRLCLAGAVREKPLEPEQYHLEVTDTCCILTAGDDLGFVYGLLYLSGKYLGIKPFWFWMDQEPARKEKVEIAPLVYLSPKPSVRFRGWFFNDEVLMMKWKYNENGVDGWMMAFEALLRCGGNMAIPGTDKMSRKNRRAASQMGLWITHHHAEPLGAEMFVRAYPELEANYMEHKELFHKLWEEAVLEQKDCKVVWNLCFRGQGDAPFWSSDTTGQFDTPEKQGNMISDMIRTQSEIVRKHVENPVFCTNLYGEIMELYQQGYIELDPEIIKVRADNGYGRMVTRRRDNHCARVSSMPDPADQGAQGIYYHVSFYDLQAANHITMLPNSVSFVDRELSKVMENGGDDFWIINCSNVRPHVYYLDAVRKKWYGRSIDDEIHSREFADDYFDGREGIARCYREYPEAMISYGPNEDDHMGEQFYTENLRLLAHQFLVDKTRNARQLFWVTGEVSLEEQVKKVCGLCRGGLDKLDKLLRKCEAVQGSRLLEGTLLLQIRIHYECARGAALFGDGYQAYLMEDYARAFVLFGRSADCFELADSKMRESEYGVWKDFYKNDCFADVKHTAYLIRKVMGYIRELGDNARHDKWYHEYCYTKEDRKVCLLLVLDNHMTDQELYEVMRDAF